MESITHGQKRLTPQEIQQNIDNAYVLRSEAIGDHTSMIVAWVRRLWSMSLLGRTTAS